jgi:hypothetical protein
VVTSPPSSDDKPGWLTHTEAADLVGVSYNTVAHWARQKKLHPHKEQRTLANGTVREVTVFSLQEVIKLARRRGVPDAGEMAARAFELFMEGTPLHEVVIKLRQAPERIEALHEQWLSCGASELVLNPVARRELERLVGPFNGVAELVQRVAELASRAAADVSPEPSAR